MLKCWLCGKPATKSRFDMIPYGLVRSEDWDKRDHWRAYCDECFTAEMDAERREHEEYIRLKKREMLKTALGKLEKQGVDMYAYKEAIDVVADVLTEKPDNFDSSYEVMAAIVLVQNRVRAKMQYKVVGYQVDFLLPDDLVVLEIDGDRHRHRKQEDTERDRRIKKALGQHWEIVRIKTEYLDKKAEALPTAIKNVLLSRKAGRVNWRELYG